MFLILKEVMWSAVHLAKVPPPTKKQNKTKRLWKKKKKSLNKHSIKYGENVERYFITRGCNKCEFSIKWPKLNTETYTVYSLMELMKIQFLSKL